MKKHPPWLGWMALTDPYRQGKERELARDGESMGGGRCSPTEYMSAHCAQVQIQNDIITWRSGEICSQTVPWIIASDFTAMCRLTVLFACMHHDSLLHYMWFALVLWLHVVCSACKRSGRTQISNMHDVTLTHMTVGSPPHAHMWLFIHAHVVTLRWSC